MAQTAGTVPTPFFDICRLPGDHRSLFYWYDFTITNEKERTEMYGAMIGDIVGSIY